MAVRFTFGWAKRSLIVAVVLMAGACGADTSETAGSDEWAGEALVEPVAKPDFVLTDLDGRPFDFRSETAGRLTFLYFGYTSCPDICPVHLAQLSEALGRPGMPRDPAVVFVTVDPDRDTPERVRDYLDTWDEDFIGLTGSAEALEAAQLAAGVTPAYVEPDDDPDDDAYLVGHAGQILAYAPDGYAYTVYPFGTRQTELVHDLPLLAEIRGDEFAALG